MCVVTSEQHFSANSALINENKPFENMSPSNADASPIITLNGSSTMQHCWRLMDNSATDDVMGTTSSVLLMDSRSQLLEHIHNLSVADA